MAGLGIAGKGESQGRLAAFIPRDAPDEPPDIGCPPEGPVRFGITGNTDEIDAVD